MPHEGFGEVAERLRRSTVQVIQQGRSGGSGVIWNSEGRIITNAHVVRSAKARVQLWDGRSFDGEVTSTDTRRDLAAVRIPAAGLPAATAGDSDSLRPGELVMAVGNPLGFIGALTTGVVHAVGPLRGLGRRIWVQAAVRLAPGNSGGPLADAQGRVIGLNTMIAGGGLALAVPSNAIARFVQEGGSRAALGVVVQPVSLGRDAVGLLILEVSPNGPAAQGSLQIGDVLVGADGQSFHSPEDLTDALEQSHGALTIEFLRGDRKRLRKVTVGAKAA